MKAQMNQCGQNQEPLSEGDSEDQVFSLFGNNYQQDDIGQFLDFSNV